MSPAQSADDDFGDLTEFLVVEPKILPINGRRYEFPGDVSARAYLVIQHTMEQGVRAKRAADAGQPYDPTQIVLDDDEELDLQEELFGDARSEMIADGLTASQLQRVMATLMLWHAYGRDAAVAVWRQGEAPAPNRAARRASKGSGSTTKRPASGSGTSSRRTSLAAGTTVPSPGAGSSGTGRSSRTTSPTAASTSRRRAS